MYKTLNYKKTIIKENSKIKDVIKNINKSELKISIVVNKKKNFVGIINDGDIRRGLISGLNLNSQIKKIINRSPLIVSDNVNEKKIKVKMEKNQIFHVPIINQSKKIVGIYCYEPTDKNVKFSNTVVIMSGGVGSRLRPITYKTPKALVKINNKPLLHYIINNIKSSGFKNFVISTGYKSKKIINYFKNGKKLGVKIQYVKEKKPLGTAGALSLIKNKLKEDFIVTNCDVISHVDYYNLLDFHKKNNAYMTIAAREFESRSDFGEIFSQGINVRNIVEKPVKKTIVNAGIYIFNKKALSDLKYNVRIDINEFIKILLKKRKKIILCPIHERWLDVGTKSSYKTAKNYV